MNNKILMLTTICIFQAATFSSGETSTSGGGSTNGPPIAYEFDPGTALDLSRHGPPESSSNAPILISPGEALTISLNGIDPNDRSRPIGTIPWTFISGGGPYELKFTCSGEADFDSIGSGRHTKTVNSLTANNISVYPKANWVGNNHITINVTAVDLQPAATSPDIGSAQDSSVGLSWELAKRINPPTTIQTISGNNGQWININAGQAAYQYVVGPDPAPAYQGQAVAEYFGPVTSGGLFGMSDLEAQFKSANPTLNTPDKVAASLFAGGASTNTSFVIDASNTFTDFHSGFAANTLGGIFTHAALIAGNCGYGLSQVYSAGNNVLGSYSILRRVSFNPNASVEVEKLGP